jgi:hypothetical protein
MVKWYRKTKYLTENGHLSRLWFRLWGVRVIVCRTMRTTDGAVAAAPSLHTMTIVLHLRRQIWRLEHSSVTAAESKAMYGRS